LGVELLKGDLGDAPSLQHAMKGVHGVFSIQTPYGPGGVELETRNGIAVADAAKAAKVEHLVYSSVGGAERNTGIPHFESKFRIEQHILSLDIHATILRPAFFMSNFAGPAGPREVGGELVLRMALPPEKKLQMISLRDIGVFAALAFEGHEGIAGRAIEIAGDELSPREMAGAFSAVVGRPVRFEQMPISELEKISAETAKMFRWFEASGYQADLPNLRRLNPELRKLGAWIAEEHWKPAAS
jgi:uncharacterized protein YbjT (DUF2867 family)